MGQLTVEVDLNGRDHQRRCGGIRICEIGVTRLAAQAIVQLTALQARNNQNVLHHTLRCADICVVHHDVFHPPRHFRTWSTCNTISYYFLIIFFVIAQLNIQSSIVYVLVVITYCYWSNTSIKSISLK